MICCQAEIKKLATIKIRHIDMLELEHGMTVRNYTLGAGQGKYRRLFNLSKVLLLFPFILGTLAVGLKWTTNSDTATAMQICGMDSSQRFSLLSRMEVFTSAIF